MKPIRKHSTARLRKDDRVVSVEILSSALIRRATIKAIGPWLNIEESDLKVRHSHHTFTRMRYPNQFGELRLGDRVLVRVQNALIDDDRITWTAEVIGDILS